MALFTRTDCPVHVDHKDADRAAQRLQGMSTPDLYSWASNVAADLQALVEFAQKDEVDVIDLALADAMMHACVVEITKRRSA